MLGITIAKATLGGAALLTVSLIIGFNALTLWTHDAAAVPHPAGAAGPLFSTVVSAFTAPLMEMLLRG